MTPRERFIAALERRPFVGRVPHFELVFFLTMECFGKVHPSHRSYRQWDQMRRSERELHIRDMAELYVATAERFEHDAIFLHPNPQNLEEEKHLIDAVRNLAGERYFIMLHGDATHGIPDGDGMLTLSYRMVDDAVGLQADSTAWVDAALARAEALRAHGGLDGFALCSDYCFNDGPFFSPDQFSEFVTPHLRRLIAEYRAQGFYVIKHSDGNIMPIVDQLVDCAPHALHSLDPQCCVDLAEMKRRFGDRVCLIGNVNCGLLDTGTDEQVDADVRRSLRDGMPGGGYIFSTSNCIYTGMRLSRYERMLKIWRDEGVWA